METHQKEKPAILTVKEAAEYLRLSEMTVLRLAHQGMLPGAKVGRQWRFQRESILNLIKYSETQGVEPRV